MTPLVFADHRQLNDYIATTGPLPRDREVRVGTRVILPGRSGGTHCRVVAGGLAIRVGSIRGRGTSSRATARRRRA